MIASNPIVCVCLKHAILLIRVGSRGPPWYMALLNDDALESGENVDKIASERSERADF